MENNRFYRINNPKEKQFTTEYVNLDDISSVHLPNESMNLGIVVMKTGKDVYVHREELDKIIGCLSVINTPSNQKLNETISKIFDIYEPNKNHISNK